MAGKIPSLSDKKLEERVKTIKPVLRFLEKEKGKFYRNKDEGELYYLQKSHSEGEGTILVPRETKIRNKNQDSYGGFETIQTVSSLNNLQEVPLTDRGFR